jgi:hypothetical protein
MTREQPGRSIVALARTGYAARGFVYLIVGGLAVVAAIGAGGEATGPRGALQTLLGQPFGRALLAIVAAGLLSFAIWRGVQVILDPDRYGAGFKGLIARFGRAISCVAHIALTFAALSLVFGWGSGGGDDQAAKDWTATLMSQPFGRWLVGGFGLGVVAAGARSAVKGWGAKFEKRLDQDGRDARWAVMVSQFGLIARGFVFTIIGGFLIVAAMRANAEEARGLGGALRALQEQPYGSALLAVVAAGLIAFGVYCFVDARYRRIGPANEGRAT